MFCRKCGKQILDDSRFCQYCGEAVQVVAGQVVEKTVKVSPEIAQNGGSLAVTIDGITKPIDIMLPPNMKDGQVLCLKKAKITDKESGKTVKKDLFIKISVTQKNESADE